MLKTDVVVRDTNDRIVPFVGKCWVDCVYENQKNVVPILVKSGGHAFSVIGPDWFNYLKFYCNQLFDDIVIQQKIHNSKENGKVIIGEKDPLVVVMCAFF